MERAKNPSQAVESYQRGVHLQGLWVALLAKGTGQGASMAAWTGTLKKVKEDSWGHQIVFDLHAHAVACTQLHAYNK